MDFKIPKGSEKALGHLADKAYNTFKKYNPLGFSAMQGSTISLSTGSVGIDAAMGASPIMVGDSNIGQFIGRNATNDSLLKAGKLGMAYQYNGLTKKWDVHFKPGHGYAMTGDSVADFAGSLYMRPQLTTDAVGTLINGSLLSPNSIGWITELFKQPLSWSRADELVKIQTGTSPWAVTQAMAAVRPSGWGAVNSAGGAGNTMTQDVEGQLEMIEQQIINIDVTYKLTIEELERSKSGDQNYPLAGQVIAYKQAYAKWIPDIIKAGQIYYGNTATGNAGLLTINSITAWTSVGSNLAVETIAAGASTTKGSLIYQQFAQALVSFLNPMKNNCRKVHATMSVEAFNAFATVPYSDAYNPNNALKIFGESFDAGGRKVLSGSIGSVLVEIAPDPMLSGSGRGNFFNPQTYDYLVLTADELAAGPSDETQSLIHYGEPLAEFVYPVYPQQFSTQYRYLKRVSGIFAPYASAIKVYSGYGYAS